MLNLVQRVVLLLLPLSVPHLASAARGLLTAEGIIKVRGADASLVLVTVVPGDAPAYTLPIGTTHFTLRLPLDAVYLIRVEREGCPSKEILVDATVPQVLHVPNFVFPFLVTLEHLAPNRMFAYDGPVGYVRYTASIKDFGYETSYNVRTDEVLEQRMVVLRATGIDPGAPTAIYSARAVDLPRGGYSVPSEQVTDPAGEVAPTVSEVPRLIHVVATEPAAPVDILPGPPEPLTTTIAPIPEEPVMLLLPAIVAIPSIAPAPMRAATASKATALPRKRTTASAAPDAASRTTSVLVLGGSAPSRAEELIIEPRRVTRILQLKQRSGIVTEFKKVTHAFGATFYFRNDLAITERAFDEATTP